MGSEVVSYHQSALIVPSDWWIESSLYGLMAVPARGSPVDWTVSGGRFGSADGLLVHLNTSRIFFFLSSRLDTFSPPTCSLYNSPVSLTLLQSISSSRKHSPVALVTQLATTLSSSNLAHDWSSPESSSSFLEESSRMPTPPFPANSRQASP